MRQADLVRYMRKGRTMRTSQIVFGERQHLLRVLDSMEHTKMADSRLNMERRSLEELIHARTVELNRINPDWDQKVGVVLNAATTSQALEHFARQAPREDFYLLRLISEHPKVSAKTLRLLGRHTYSAIRENVARHPNTDAATLRKLSADRTQPLWYLVAFNPSAPEELREQLRARIQRQGQRR